MDHVNKQLKITSNTRLTYFKNFAEWAQQFCKEMLHMEKSGILHTPVVSTSGLEAADWKNNTRSSRLGHVTLTMSAKDHWGCGLFHRSTQGEGMTPEWPPDPLMEHLPFTGQSSSLSGCLIFRAIPPDGEDWLSGCMVIPAGKALRRVLAMQEGTSEELGLNIVLSIFKHSKCS